ncbi:MAG: GntR family transcriptional regulator [Planctomycetes bacterium]|nr:GntR family transcriptional regulator [Planctomycetota bacterium]
MPWKIQLVTNSPAPIFGQIVQQVRQAVAQGLLHAGDRLPTVRELADELVVNPNTIAKAYTELERAGVIAARRGAGTFIADGQCALTAEERERILTRKIEECLTEAVHLGLTQKHVLRLFTETAGRFRWPMK